MIQMPWLVLFAAAALSYARLPAWRSALACGLAGALATLSFVSNLFVVAGAVGALGLHLLRLGKANDMTRLWVGVGAMMLGATGAAFVAAWAAAADPGVGLLQWMGTHGGSATGRVSGTFGVAWSARGLLLSLARTGVGFVSALVDQALAFDTLRGIADAPVEAAFAAAAGVGAVVLLVRGILGIARSDGAAALAAVAAGWAFAVGAFSLLWSNSDGQFFFQLAVPIALVAPVAGARVRPRSVVAATVLVLGWNVFAATKSKVLFPRRQIVGALSAEVAKADLVLFPGWDTIGQMLFFVPQGRELRMALMDIADKQPPERGFVAIDSVIANVLDRGGSVLVLGVFDANPAANPWKALRAMGYPKDRVDASLTAHGAMSQKPIAGIPVAWLRR